ncbi:hypothetical protein GGR57DRAFT_88671 [Xylariaceae sp. FL1272]|nr:hypothetical protein GGR57DRAFT_88671 [Xylariaceae sp. FL1272]
MTTNYDAQHNSLSPARRPSPGVDTYGCSSTSGVSQSSTYIAASMKTGVPRKESRRPKTRSKAGCNTCRIRKVKCDEGFPACNRCASSGRSCDGYGIWGGGVQSSNLNKPPGGNPSRAVVAIPQFTRPSSLVGSTLEMEYFDWFQHRTLAKIPGTAGASDHFWSTLLLQACFHERAIFNAVLALSSVHRNGCLRNATEGPQDTQSGKGELFALDHYLRAIADLQPCFFAKDRASFRVTLITCVIFFASDCLRGHFVTAQNHLRSGLKLLKDMQLAFDGSPASKPDGLLLLEVNHDPSDLWTTEMFSRLYVQAEVLHPAFDPQHIPLPVPDLNPELTRFTSLRVAWLEINRLFCRVFALSNQARYNARNPGPSCAPGALEATQQVLLADLDRWSTIYEASRQTLGKRTIGQRKIILVLSMYHTMATIMAHTALCPGDEAVFDSHMGLFLFIIDQMTCLFSFPEDTEEWTHSIPFIRSKTPTSYQFDIARSMVDVGCIAQIYYTAIKCRNHSIRLRAVTYLEAMSHREGLWDARITSIVARKVMDLEEQDYYGAFAAEDEFLTKSEALTLPLLRADPSVMSLPILPVSQRLRDVGVVYSGAPLDKVMLFCQGRHDGSNERVCIGEYDVGANSWAEMM